MCELIVILKDEARTYRQTFLIYENFTVSLDDVLIKNCIVKAKEDFEGEPDSIHIKINLEVQ